MKSLRKALAIVLFVIMGFPLCMAGLSAVSMKKWLQDSKPWKELVHDARLVSILESKEPAAFMPERITVAETSLNGKALASSVLQVIAPSVFVSTADSAIDGIFRFAESAAGGAGNDTIPALELAPLKSALKGKGASIAKEYIALNDKEAFSEKEAKVLGTEFEKIIAGLPEQVPMIPQDSEISFTSKKITTLNQGLNYLIFGAAGILLACAFVADNSWRKRSIFLGTTMMVPGVMILVAGFLPYLVSPSGMLKTVTQNPLSAFPLTLEYVRYILTSLSSGFRISGIITVTLAVIFLSARFLPTGDGETEA